MNKKRILSSITAVALIVSLMGGVMPARAAEDPGFSLVAGAVQQDGTVPMTLNASALEQKTVGSTGGYAVDAIRYSTNNENVVISADGVVSLKAGYVPTGDVTATITADVDYYSAVYSDSFEANYSGYADLTGERVLQGAATKELTNVEKGKFAEMLVGHARTGGYAITPAGTKVGSNQSSLAVSPMTGVVTMWVYHPGDLDGTREIKFAPSIKSNALGSPTNLFAMGYCIEGTSGAYFYDNVPYFQVRNGGSSFDTTGYVNEVTRTQGWHKFQWFVDPTSGLTMKIDDKQIVATSAATKTFNLLSLGMNWVRNNNWAAGRCFVDDVSIVSLEDYAAGVKTAQTTAEITLEPNIEYVLVGETEVNYNKADPSAVKATMSPAVDPELKVTRAGTELSAGTDYAIDGNDIVFKPDYLAGLETGLHEFTFTISNNSFNFQIIVIDTASFRTFYFSNETGDDTTGEGTEAKPWKTMEKLNAMTFLPGDTICLDAQSVWTGQIKLKDSGAPGSVITLTKYNDGGNREQRPIINGGPVIREATQPKILALAQGTASRAAGTVEIWNASYWKLSGLEITNNGGEAVEKRIVGRNGIMVIADLPNDTVVGNYNARWEASKQTSIDIDDCYVHDVNSSTGYKLSGGINFFGNIDDIMVENCTIIDCDVEGIRNAGLYAQNNSWPQVHKVVFRNNYIAKSAGDGMVVSNVFDSTISGNVVTECGKPFAGTANYAALWLIGAKNTVVEGNEVFNNKQRCNDGEAFDFDYNCVDSIYQYNYTHHNVGGAILFMPTPSNNIYRYNISVEDGNSGATKPHLFFYAGGSASNAPFIYNNVFMVGPETTSLFDSGGATHIYFYNNILMSTNGNIPAFTSGSFSGGFVKNNVIYPKSLLNATYTSAVTVSDNLFTNPQLGGPGAAPENIMLNRATANATLDLTKLTPYKLMAASPAINAGLVYELPRTIDRDRPVTVDFFKNPIVGKPDIGVHEWTNDSPEQTVTEIPLTGIEVTADKTELKVEATTILRVSTTPTNAWNSGVTWSTSDAEIATVDEYSGVVTAVGAGTAVITATADANGAITDAVSITVKQPPHLVGFRVAGEHNYVQDTGSLQLSVVGVDNEGNDYFIDPNDIKSVVYTPSVGTVDTNGVLTIPQGTPAGDVTVTAAVQVQQFDYLENFETGNTLEGGSTSLVRTDRRSYDGTWSMETRDNSATDDDAFKKFSTSRQGTVTIQFYDTAGTTLRKAVNVSPNTTLYALGVHKDGSSTHYSHRIKNSSWTASSVARTTGWHEFKWVFSDAGLSAYIDGVLVESNTGVKNYNTISILSRKGWTQGDHNGKLGIDAIKAWTEASGIVNHTAAALTLHANPTEACEINVESEADRITTNYGALQMSAEFLPVGSGEVTWSVVPGTGTADIDSTGRLTARSNGTVTVRATSVEHSDLFGEKHITISGSLVHVEGISVTLVNGENPPTRDKERTQLLAHLTPVDAGNQNVTWSITNTDGSATDLATIDRTGMMVAWKDGTVRVTATSKETTDVSGWLDIPIVGQGVRAESVTIAESAALTTGTECTLTAAVAPANAASTTVNWSITDLGGTNATVDALTGRLKTGSIPGNVAITARANDGSGARGTLSIPIERAPAKAVVVGAKGVPTAGIASVYDGNPKTAWRSEVAANQSVVLELDGLRSVDCLTYNPELGALGVNGAITDYTIALSTDGASYTAVATGTWARDNAEKTVYFRSAEAKFVKISTTNQNGAYVSVAELSVGLGVGNGVVGHKAYGATYYPVLDKDPTTGAINWEQIFVPTTEQHAIADYMNDHSIWKATDGKWHMLGISGGKNQEYSLSHSMSTGGITGPWVELPHVAEYVGDGTNGWKTGALDAHAPYVFAKDGVNYNFYRNDIFHNDRNSLALDTSGNLTDWTRHLEVNYSVPASEELNAASPLFKRDIMILDAGEKYYMYSVAMDDAANGGNGRSAITAFESTNLIDWTFAKTVWTTTGGSNVSWSSAESPFVFRYGGQYYLSVTLTGSDQPTYHQTLIFASDDPLNFGNFDGNINGAGTTKLVTELPLHAPEYIFDEENNQWYVTTCGWADSTIHEVNGVKGKGVMMAKLDFEPNRERAIIAETASLDGNALTVNLGGRKLISGVTYVPAGTTYITGYTISVSIDGVTYTPVQKAPLNAWGADAREKRVDFAPVEALYVRITADTQTGNDLSASTMKVHAIGAVPTIQNRTLSVAQGEPLNGLLHGVGSALTFAIASSPTNGTISGFDAALGTFTYLPAEGYSGADSFTYTAGGETATMSIQVISADDLKIAEVKVVLENATYHTTQAECADEDGVLALIQTTVTGLVGGYGVAADVTRVNYTEAVAGTENVPNGTPGTYVFTVSLSRGTGTPVTTAELTLTIAATVYVAPPSAGGTRPTNTETETVKGGEVTIKTNRNGSVTYTFKPEAGKEVLYLRVNGLLVKTTGSYTSPKGTVESVVVVFGDPTAGTVNHFTDVTALPDYMTDAVKYVVGSGLFEGVGETSFAPTAEMSRAMFATVLARLYGAKTEEYTVSNFADVKMDTWYGPSVAWVAKMDIAGGVDATSFAPDRSMTRQELVTLVHRFAKLVGADISATGELETFADADKVDDWAQEAMKWAVAVGLINGRGDGLAPTATITRVEAAIVLERMATMLVKA